MHGSRVRLGTAFLAIALTPLLGGCALFGIATRGNLDEQQEDFERRNQALQAEIETVSADLEALESTLDPRLAQLEKEVDAFGDVSARMIAIDETLKAARQDLAILEGRVTRDLREFEADLTQASEAGQRVADAYLDDLRQRRRDLRRQLEELDTALTNWDRMGRDLSAPRRSSTDNRSGTNAVP